MLFPGYQGEKSASYTKYIYIAGESFLLLSMCLPWAFDAQTFGSSLVYFHHDVCSFRAYWDVLLPYLFNAQEDSWMPLCSFLPADYHGFFSDLSVQSPVTPWSPGLCGNSVHLFTELYTLPWPVHINYMLF